jgi:hypothetical protein
MAYLTVIDIPFMPVMVGAEMHRVDNAQPGERETDEQ